MTTHFAIRVADVQEMITARETLRALGFPIYPDFEGATTTADYPCVVFNGEVCRGSPGWKRPVYASLQDYLNKRFDITPVETPAQKELAKLEASAEALNKQIAALKATL